MTNRYDGEACKEVVFQYDDCGLELADRFGAISSGKVQLCLNLPLTVRSSGDKRIVFDIEPPGLVDGLFDAYPGRLNNFRWPDARLKT